MPRAKSVSGAARRKVAPILATSVSSPVFIASTVPVPLRTEVPAKTILVRAIGAAACAAGPGCLVTGKLSPVSTDSLTLRSMASMTTPSAGIRAPAASSNTSPGTTSLAGTPNSARSRRTRAVMARRPRSASMAREARYSCAKPSSPLASTMAMMTAASLHSPTTAATAAPKMRMSTSGVAN